MLLREAFSHSYISFFHLLVYDFFITTCRAFFVDALPSLFVGGIGGMGGIKMASSSTPSANEPAKDHVLVHTVQLKPMTKAQISGRMVSSGITGSFYWWV